MSALAKHYLPLLWLSVGMLLYVAIGHSVYGTTYSEYFEHWWFMIGGAFAVLVTRR